MKPPKCFICEQKHWASEPCPVDDIVGTTAYIDGRPLPKVEGTTYVVDDGVALTSMEHPYNPDVCPECGTNLTARDKERDRRKKYMREYRKRETP